MASPIDIVRSALPGAATGAALGGGLGALSGMSSPAESFGDRLRSMGRGALSGGLTGGLFGGAMGAMGGNYGRALPGAQAVHPESVPWMKGVTTRADAKAAYRTQARATHPDFARNEAERLVRENAMKDLNASWSGMQGHSSFPKQAFYQGVKAACVTFGLRR